MEKNIFSKKYLTGFIFIMIVFYLFTYWGYYETTYLNFGTYVLSLITIIILLLIYDFKNTLNTSKIIKILLLIPIGIIILESIFGTGSTWPTTLLNLVILICFEIIYLIMHLIIVRIKK